MTYDRLRHAPHVVAIDPGIRSPGVAYVRDGVVVAAARVVVPRAIHEMSRLDHATGERARIVGRLISSWYLELAIATLSPASVDVVYELPQIYRATKSKGNPNDLLKTLATGAAAAARLDHVCARVITPTPAEWAGGTSKTTTGNPWSSERGRMVARRLTPAERAVVPDSHDAIDAVALGLWLVGRLEQIRVNHGATPG